MSRSGKSRENKRMAQVIDDLREFDEFRTGLLKKIQAMLKDGKTSEEILEFGKAMAAARVVTTVAVEKDSQKALAAAKDVLDRTQGKAKERTEVEHKFSKLPEDQLDAMLLSKLKEVTSTKEDESH